MFSSYSTTLRGGKTQGGHLYGGAQHKQTCAEHLKTKGQQRAQPSTHVSTFKPKALKTDEMSVMMLTSIRG